MVKPLDLNLSQDFTIPWEKAFLRVFISHQENDVGPPLGEVVVEDRPRKVVARVRNKSIQRYEGVFKVSMPPGWQLPESTLRFPFLLSLESRHGEHSGRVTFCACFGRVKNRTAGTLERAVVAFESYSPVFLIPTNVDVEEVLKYETLLAGNPTDIIHLVQYHDWLYENAKSWVRKVLIGRMLRKLATGG
jgi:hypothetical protein